MDFHRQIPLPVLARFVREVRRDAALSESAERLDIDPDQMVAWLKLWWSEDEFWRGMRRSSGFGPDVAHLMRGVADMIDGQQQSASDGMVAVPREVAEFFVRWHSPGEMRPHPVIADMLPRLKAALGER